MVQKNSLKNKNVQREIKRKEKGPINGDKSNRIKKTKLNHFSKKIKATLTTSAINKIEQQLISKANKNGARCKLLKNTNGEEANKKKLVKKLKSSSFLLSFSHFFIYFKQKHSNL